jgi:hypothetical protein
MVNKDGVMASSAQVKGEVSREDLLRCIFGDVGELMDDFSCAVESTVLLHGRLYVTDRCVCFYSNLFGLEKKIRIPFTVVTKENSAVIIPNAIAISSQWALIGNEVSIKLLSTY